MSVKERVSGLDSVRFVCALWVFFGHGHQPPVTNPFDVGTLLYWGFRGIYGNLWSGPAAVIVFFVVSGFCIHYPFAKREDNLPVLAFLARRWVRLGLPMAIAIPLAQLHGQSLALFEETLLWSLLAELVYYSIYPLLRNVWTRHASWLPMLAVAFFLALIVLCTNPGAVEYPKYGPWLNWVLGLPCWLMGCLLADWIRSGRTLSVGRPVIWAWRAAVLASASLCSVLRFHSPIGYPWTLDLFAVLVLFWLHREISFRFYSPPMPILEWAGGWSYSLYLMHTIAAARFSIIFPETADSVATWFVKLMFVLAGCYVFYLLVEKPSHVAGRWLGTWIDSRKLEGHHRAS